MSQGSEAPLTERLERALEAVGINAVIEESGEEIVISGRVDSAEARQAAEEIAGQIAPQRRITNDLEVEEVVPTTVSQFYAGEALSADVPDSTAELSRRGLEIDPDFTDQPLDTSGLEESGVDPSAEGDDVFFPPTDPVVAPARGGELDVVGGFSATSTEDVSVERSALDGRIGDEAIADAVQRELREDAITTDLLIDVYVRQGVVHLRGRVQNVEEGEQVEEVARRVPGVVDVVDELEVSTV
ncbi:MAG TPA: BON domain-containing protein [Chloroflexota bacterium]|jgi:osmotically-inducible protein OsmY|nr:BON domain-containing protein [Chloroflexota bacterium]